MNKDTKIDDVIKWIQKQIQSGLFVAGQRLPSERELAKQLTVSRSTIRSALQRLQAENLIDIVPRGGIFIRSSAPKITMGEESLPLNQGPELQKSGSFIHSMRKQGRDIVVRYLEPSRLMPAGTEIGKRLNIKPTHEVLKRYRVQQIDRVPYRILDGYYLGELTKELVGQEDHTVPLFQWLLEHKNFRTTRAAEKLSCRMPTEKEALHLNIARNQPVVEMHRWIWGIYEGQSHEIPYEFSKIVCNAALHEFQYSYDIQKEALN